MLGFTKRTILSGLCFTVFSAAGVAQAESEFIWTSEDGMKAADSCAVKADDQIGLRIAQTTNSSKDLRALIRSTDNLKSFELYAVSSEQNNRTNQSVFEKMKLTESSTKDLSDFVLEVNKPLGDSHVPMKGSFLQAAMNGNQFVSFVCGKNQYIAFDVFVAQSRAPIARVGVALKDMLLLKDIRIHTNDEAEKSLDGQSDKNKDAKQDNVTAQPAFRAASAPAQGSGAAAQPTTAVVNVPVPRVKPAIPPKTVGDVAVEGRETATQLVCSAGSVQVLDQDLKTVLFSANSGDKVVQMQSFGSSQSRNQDGKTYVMVQFSNSKSGWIDSSNLRTQAQCAVPVLAADAKVEEVKSVQPALDVMFPMIARPVASYKTAQRRFRAPRDHGARLHAACDLYRPENEKVVAIGKGSVIHGIYKFYQGVFAIEVKHSNGLVIRYGEVTGKVASGISEGKSVSMGQVVGYVGKVNSGCCAPMLHFEMFSGAGKGPLSVFSSKGFQRRSDLMDPTSRLSTWEKAQFGKSY